MPKKKVHYEFLPIYERNIFYGSDVKAIKEEILKYYKEEDLDLETLDEHLDGKVHLPQGFSTYIENSKIEDKVELFILYVRPDSDIGTVAHEAVHVTNQLFTYIGQDLDIVNDETQAYLVGHLVKTFMENIRGEKKSTNSTERKKRTRG